MPDTKTLEDFEKHLTQHPSDYFGVINEWIDEGFSSAMFSHNRDSDILEEANWKSICEKLQKWIDGDEGAVRITTSNHWAVGWVESIHVKIRNRKGEFTKAFRVAVAIRERLANYPILDEVIYSSMEEEDLYKYIEEEVGVDKAEACLRWLRDTYSISSSDDLRYDWIEEWKETSHNAA